MQNKLVKDIMLPVVRRSALYARSEVVLKAMIFTLYSKLHAEAVEIILIIRGTSFDNLEPVGRLHI